MPESHGIPAQVIRAFKENPVWDEIWEKRMKLRLKTVMDAAIDDSDARAAGEYRALETVKGIPDQLLKEIKEESTLPQKVKKLVGRRTWL